MIGSLRLSGVMLSCNENPKYLDFWPVVKRAWREIVRVPVILVYCGAELPDHLKEDTAVYHYKPPAECRWPTATVAQAIRLLFPAVMECPGAVLIGDIDCMPLNAHFFLKEIAKAREDQFVSLKGIMEEHKEVCMMYVAAKPKVWGEMFGVKTLRDIDRILTTWSSERPADGRHSGVGWTSDQMILYKAVKALPPDRLRVVDWEWDFPRLDRSMPYEWIQMTPYLQSRLYYNHYIDFHLPPYEQFQKQIWEVLEMRVKIGSVEKSAPGI